jgi:hypothetical protein
MAEGTIAFSVSVSATHTDGEVFANTIKTKTITDGAENLPKHKTVMALSNSYATIDLGDVSTTYKHNVTIRNTDASIICYVSFNASTDHLEIGPGEIYTFTPKGGITTSVKSASGTPSIELLVSQLKNA